MKSHCLEAEGILALIWTNVWLPTLQQLLPSNLLSEHCYQRHRDIASRVFWFSRSGPIIGGPCVRLS
jgi:hypothetical protein